MELQENIKTTFRKILNINIYISKNINHYFLK